MANLAMGPGKRRTRAHVIADLSVHYVEGFILREGHTAERIEKDYGYDLFLFTFDEEGYAEPGFIAFQLKAAESLRSVGSDYVFDLDLRDYNLRMMEDFPVILVLFDATRERAYWLDIQTYFGQAPRRRPKRGVKTVRVRVPVRQMVNQRSISTMRARKGEARLRLMEEES